MLIVELLGRQDILPKLFNDMLLEDFHANESEIDFQSHLLCWSRVMGILGYSNLENVQFLYI